MDNGSRGSDACDPINGRWKAAASEATHGGLRVALGIATGVPTVLSTNSPGTPPLGPLVDLALILATSIQR